MPGDEGFVAAAEVAAPFKILRRGPPLRDVAQAFFDLVEALIDLDLAGIELAFLPLFGLPVDFLIRCLLVEQARLFVVQSRLSLIEHGESLVAAQQVYGVGIGQAREGLLHPFQRGGVAPDHLQLRFAIAQRIPGDADEEVLGQIHVHRQVVERHLRLDHPELGQMAARLRLLGAEGGTEGVDFAESHRHGFAVELAALCQIGRLAEVVDLEERAGAFDGVFGEDRRVHLDKPTLLKKSMDGHDDAVAHPHDGPLAAAAQPEVPVIHQKLDAVCFGRDRILVGFADQRQRCSLDFVAAHLAFVPDDAARHGQGAFLRGSLGGLPRGFIDLLLVDDALRHA